MPRDQTMTKREQIKSSKKTNENVLNRKYHNDSDSDNSDDSDDYEEDEDEMDVHEYRKFLAKIFPSKNLDKNIKMGDKIKKLIKSNKKIDNDSENDNDTDDNDDNDDTDSDYKPSKTSKKKDLKKTTTNKKITKKSKIIKKDKSSSKTKKNETSDDDDNDDDDDEEENYTSKGDKFNIIFTIGGNESYDDDEWEDYDDEDDEVEDTENEDEEVSSDESSDEDDDDDYDDDVDESETDDDHDKKCKKKNKNNNIKKDNSKSERNEIVASMIKDVLNKTSSSSSLSKDESILSIEKDEEILKSFKELENKYKGNKIITECIKVCKNEMKDKQKKHDKKIKKTKEKHGRIFKKIIRDKNTMNDFDFFNKLDIIEQKKIIKEVREINKITRIEKPYRLTLLEADIPPIFKAAAMKKINSLRYMEPGTGEFYKIKNWVETFMRIPFGKFKTLPVNIKDGVDMCHEFIANAQKTLNDAVYGLNDAKMQIMQLLGQLVTNPEAIGTAIAIHGPPGTGKTSLVKEGISKILNRPFAFIALGGATDSSFLEGHSYTYEGSIWGKIVQILIDSKCMNPVIYFDELDKISDTPKGEEIAGILTHLTDTTQNSQFHDKYFSEIDFDLSKCLFIFSYNDESKVNPILKDRMYRIMTKGYDQKQKTFISNNYLLPKIRDQIKFLQEDIIIPDDTIHHIIEKYCNKEDGVRNLKRCMEIIYTKLNLYRLMKSDSNLFEEEMALKVEFPFTVTKNIVDKLIKTDRDINMTWQNMYL